MAPQLSAEKPYSFWLSWRFVMVVMFFWGCFNLYTLRANMSVAMVCMVNNTAISQLQARATNTSVEEARAGSNLTGDGACAGSSQPGATGHKDADGSFVWDKPTQGVILSAFFWGYLVTQIPGGWLAYRFGSKWLMGCCMLLTAALAFATPAVAALGHMPLAVLRAGQGLLEGVYFPAFFTLYSRWAVPVERSRILSFSVIGLTMASIVVNPVSGVVCATLGWPSIFYIFAAITVVWFVLWSWLVSEDPDTHRYISDEEKTYIEDALRGDIAFHEDHKHKGAVPIKSMMLSVVFWAVSFGHTAATWGLYTMLTNLPTYLREVLKLDIKTNGLYSALPYISSWLVMACSGRFADFLIERNVLSVLNVRRLMQTLGVTVPAVFLVAVGYIDCSTPVLAISLLTIGNGFFGFRTSGFGVSHTEIAPRYADVIMGLSNTVGTVPGIVAPVIIGAITTEQTQGQWQLVFWISLAVQAAGTLFYVIFIDAEVQPWAKGTGGGEKLGKELQYLDDYRQGTEDKSSPLLNRNSTQRTEL